MPKILISEKEGVKRYSIYLPKETMDSLAVKKGDELLFIAEIGGEIRFRLVRGE